MNLDFSSTEIAIGLSAAVVVACYVALILAPAWRCYGRVWERIAAGFMTLYILGTMLGAGVAIGLLVVWTYDTYA
jgi:hypothetical protein